MLLPPPSVHSAYRTVEAAGFWRITSAFPDHWPKARSERCRRCLHTCIPPSLRWRMGCCYRLPGMSDACRRFPSPLSCVLLYSTCMVVSLCVYREELPTAVLSSQQGLPQRQGSPAETSNILCPPDSSLGHRVVTRRHFLTTGTNSPRRACVTVV